MSEFVDVQAMKIRVTGDKWNYEAAYTVALLCQKYEIPFIDRLGVADAFDVPEFNTLPNSNVLPDSYVFFQHASLQDLPFTHVSPVMENVPSPKKKSVEVNQTTSASLRRIEDGSKRIRPEWKEQLAKCKAASSMNEWLTALHDLLLIPRYSTARKELNDKGVPRFVWQQSPEKAKFVYPLDDLGAVPKHLIDELDRKALSISNGFYVPEVLTTTKPLNGKSRAVLIDGYIEQGLVESRQDLSVDGSTDECELSDDVQLTYVLTVKPVLLVPGLY